MRQWDETKLSGPKNPIPVLFITYNRLAYTKEALPALLASRDVNVILIDNGSTDGTLEWLEGLPRSMVRARHHLKVYKNQKNLGIAAAMNQFRTLTFGDEFVGKVDNDTLVDADWAVNLRDRARLFNLDIVQARHPLIPDVAHGYTFDQWVASMAYPAGHPEIRYHHFVGGTGVLIRRDIFGRIPETNWKLYGWRQYQKENPHFVTAFATDVTVGLLDADGRGYKDFPNYYKETGRMKC